jgi:2,3-bisphosphoglycerate-dependent phosphoglycerate mutase
MTTLLLVRHGQTDSNRSRRLMGQSDVPMNAVGREEAASLAARLREIHIDALYTSDLARAMETACIVAGTVGIEPVPLEDLRELDVGTAVGKTRQELQLECPALFGEGWMDISFPGGESYAELTKRVGRTLRELLDRHEGKIVVVITHGGSIRAGVAALTGIPLARLISLTVANGSITRLVSLGREQVRLDALSEVSHLDQADKPQGPLE